MSSKQINSAQAQQMLDLMEQVELVSAIQAELFQEFLDAEATEYVDIRTKMQLVELAVKVLRRIASG